MNILKNTLTQGAFWQINKELVKKLGLESAVVLTDIIEKFYRFKDLNQTLIKDEKHWFFYTSQSLEETFSIKYKVQARILGDLKERGLIETKRIGVPAKMYVNLCERPMALILNSCFSQTEELESPKGQSQLFPKGKTLYNNAINNKSIPNGIDGNTEIEKGKPKRFIIPTLDALKEYFIALHAPNEAERFFDFYESKGWMVGKNKMKDWKAAVRNWMRTNTASQPKEESPNKLTF